jgi:hypothetical protein
MRRILCIAAILAGVASASAAETRYKACAIDGQIGFFSFTEAGDTVEIKILVQPKSRSFVPLTHPS